MAVQEAERRRVAGELHDEVGQTMTAVLMLLGMRDRVELTRYAIRRGLIEP